MICTLRDTLTAWYELLNGNIPSSTTPDPVPVYRWENPNSDNEYILLRMISDTRKHNAHKWIFETIVEVETVTRVLASSAVSDFLAWEIDTQIGNLAFDNPSKPNLPAQPTLRIVGLSMTLRTYYVEADDQYKYFRIVSRYTHTIELENT